MFALLMCALHTPNNVLLVLARAERLGVNKPLVLMAVGGHVCLDCIHLRFTTNNC